MNVTPLEILDPVHSAGRGNLHIAGWWLQDVPVSRRFLIPALTTPNPPHYPFSA